jgi:hypothetical protein
MTRGLAEDRFFKRNGAKKDPKWNRREKPDEGREKWVEMMNGAMQRAGIEHQMPLGEIGRKEGRKVKNPSWPRILEHDHYHQPRLSSMTKKGKPHNGRPR